VEEEAEDAEEVALFDPTFYPRSYGTSLGWRLIILTCGILLAVGALFGLAFGDYSALLQSTPMGALFLIALFAVFLCLGLYGVLYGLRFRVTLEADRVELVEPFRRRSLERSEILGCRTLPSGQGFPILVLISRGAGLGQLKIPLVVQSDEAFVRWFHDFRNLDIEQALESKQDLQETFRPELAPDERSRQIALLRRLGAGFNGTTIVALAATFLLSDPGLWLLATVAALPWIAIVLVARFQPLYRFAGGRIDERVDLILPLVVPGLILTVHAVSTLNAVGWQRPLVLACAGGLALTGVSARIDPWLRKQRWAVLVVGLFACVYGYAVGLEINAFADGSAPQMYRVKVISKEETESSHVKSWDLTLEAWGPVADRESVSVTQAQYQRIKPGDTLCVQLKAGALRIPWYRVGSCDDPAPARM
jgi:hypothetical protein